MFEATAQADQSREELGGSKISILSILSMMAAYVTTKWCGSHECLDEVLSGRRQHTCGVLG